MPKPNHLPAGAGMRFDPSPVPAADPDPSGSGLTLARFWAILYGDPPTPRERDAIMKSPTLRDHAAEVLCERGSSDTWSAPSQTSAEPVAAAATMPAAPRETFARFVPAGGSERSAHAAPVGPRAEAFQTHLASLMPSGVDSDVSLIAHSPSRQAITAEHAALVAATRALGDAPRADQVAWLLAKLGGLEFGAIAEATGLPSAEAAREAVARCAALLG